MTRDEAKELIFTYQEPLDEDEFEFAITIKNAYKIINKIYDDFEAQQKPKAVTVQVPNEYTNINREAFNEWMAYKKYKNKGAITKTLNMLNKYDYQTQQEMVDKSIMNEYKGLFEPKQQRTQTSNNVNVAMRLIEENKSSGLNDMEIIEC